MVEAGANEIPEAEILDALDIAHDADQEAVRRCSASCARRPARRSSRSSRRRSTRACSARSAPRTAPQLDAATQVDDKLERQDATKAVEEAVLEQYSGDPDADDLRRVPPARAARLRQAREADHPRAHRRPEEAPRRPRASRRSARSRSRSASLPRTHGSALFTRGQTQALSVAALGTLKEEMRLDTLGLETKKFYWHHYNFPPFSVGEAGFMRGPKRRDIGHGALAERALVPVVPTHRGLPVHDPRRLGHPRVQRLVVDGVGLRLVAVADGRGRADQASRSRASRWA